MGKEVKISLAAVGGLVVILIAVLGRGLLRSGDGPPEDGDTAVVATGEKESERNDDESIPNGGSSSRSMRSASEFVLLEKPTVIPAHSDQPPDPPRRDETDDDTASSSILVGEERVTRNGSSPGPPSFMPRAPEPDDPSGPASEKVDSRYAASPYNPFPPAASRQGEPDGHSTSSSPSEEPEPGFASPSRELVPYQHYGTNADASNSTSGAYRSESIGEGASSPRDMNSSRNYENAPSYRPSGSPYRTPDETGGARFQPTSDPAAPSYRPASSASSTRSYAPTVPGSSAAEDGKLTVQPNDSFWKISQRLYGSGVYYRALAEHNRDECPNPHRLRAGAVIDVPDLAVLREKYPESCPSEEKEETRRRRASLGGTGQSTAGDRVYVVQAGDTLYDIARYELENASRWGEIVALNRNQLGDD